MKWIKKNNEVFYPDSKELIVKISNNDLDNLKINGLSSTRKTCRYCAHLSINDKVHEMIIFHSKGKYVRPHKKIKGSESYLLIKGLMDVVFFSDDGAVKSIIKMGNIGVEKTLFFRTNETSFRSMVMYQDSVFLERKEGPYTNKNLSWAEWAPDEKDQDAVSKYSKNLLQIIKQLDN